MKSCWMICLIGFLSACNQRDDQPVVMPVASFEQLVVQYNCLGCHAPGNQMSLPVWHEVAKKYRNKADAEVYLSNKIRTGGSGAWGKMDMPPYQEITDDELRIIVHGVLSSVKPGL